MRDIQASEAKTHLPQILDEVERGQTVRITRHGRPIARIVPEFDRRQAEVDQVITNLQALRSRLGATSVDELLAWRHEGHRY
jgi:prevent-host-death family protein